MDDLERIELAILRARGVLRKEAKSPSDDASVKAMNVLANEIRRIIKDKVKIEEENLPIKS